MGWYGYQGFRSFETQPTPELKPGETLYSTISKYRGVGCALDSPPQCMELRDSTSTGVMSRKLRAKDFKIPDRRGVSASFNGNIFDTKPCAKLTIGRVSYLPVGAEASRVSAAKPEWLRRSLESSDSLHLRHLKSSYQMDIGAADEKPLDRPFMSKSGMATTTMDLCQGTTKSTYHMPGYSGHLPMAASSARLIDGATVRQPHCDIRMYYRHDIPGYTGWQAVHAKNDKGRRTCGANPKTSSGAMVLGEII